MRVKLVVVAGLVGSLVVASGASAANMWRTNHGHGSGGSTSATVSSNSGPTFNGGNSNTNGNTTGGTNGGTNGNGSNEYTGGSNGSVGVAEPTSLYAMGSALALLGAAGWTLRRKK